MPRTVWKEEYSIRAYELAKAGMPRMQIAKTIGISKPTMAKWLRKHPAFAYAVRRGHSIYKKRENGEDKTFLDYACECLPSNLHALWRKICKMEKAKTGYERIEAILERRGERVRQHLFIYAWVSCGFRVNPALRKLNISQAMFANWCKDPDFQSLLDHIDWMKKNFFEDALCQAVDDGEVSAIIHANKTYNRDRGYNDRIDLNVTGAITHGVMKVDELGLPMETRKQILEQMRRKQVESTETPLLSLPPAQPVDAQFVQNVQTPQIQKKRKKKRVNSTS